MTDDDMVLSAAKLLDRLQKEAAKRVLSAYRFESNLVHGTVIEMLDQSIVGQRTIAIRFELNGEQVETVLTVPGNVSGAGSLDRRIAFNQVADVVSRHVADEVVRQALLSFGRNLPKTPELGGEAKSP